jgi:hypothetical protein
LSPKLRQAVLFAVALLLLAVLASAVEWGKLAVTLRSAQPLPLLAAFLLTLLFPVLNMLRWESVLLANRVRVPRRRLFAITMACWPVGTLTPGKAGELLKGMAVKNRQVGLGSAIAERVVDVAVLGVYGTILGLVWGNKWAVLGGLFGLAAAGGVVLFGGVLARVLSGKKLGEKISGFLKVFPRLWQSPGLLLACALASGLNWFLSMLQLHLLLHAFGAEVSLGFICAILPAATFAGLVPITPAGVGTRDAALLFLAGGVIDPAALLAASIVYTLFGYFFLGACGLPFLHHLAPSVDRKEPR